MKISSLTLIRNHLLITCLSLTFTTISQAATSIENWFNPLSFTQPIISPNGKSIAALEYQEGLPFIVSIDLDSEKKRVLVDLKNYYNEYSDVEKLTWIDNRYVAAQLIQIRKGVDNLIDTRKTRNLIIVDTKIVGKSSLLSVRTPGWLISPLETMPNTFLYAKSGWKSHIYKIDVRKLSLENATLRKSDFIDGGQFVESNVVKSVDGYAVRWFSQNDGSITSALYYSPKDNKLTLADLSVESAQPIKSWDLIVRNKNSEFSADYLSEDNMIPLRPTEKAGEFYCINVKSLQKTAIYKVDFLDHKIEEVYTTQAYEILDIILGKNQEIVGVYVIKDAKLELEYKDKSRGERVTEPTTLQQTVSQSLDSKRSVIYRETHNQAGQYYLYDSVKKSHTLLGERLPGLTGLESTQRQGSIVVEELAIPYIVNTPKLRKSDSKFPLIVMPHGGPFEVFDHLYFDETTQFFVSQGFAVLRVNFRGSSGHSDALSKAGIKEFGGLMLEDIRQATLEVSNLPSIDSSRICAFGMSYGGYASISLTIKFPEIYRCAASFAGVMDIPLAINGPYVSQQQREWLIENIGDPEHNYQELKMQSPLYNVEALQTPILLAHGGEDRVVDVEHAFRMKMLLEKHGKYFEWFYDEVLGHTVSDPDKARALFGQIANFISKNI